MLRNITLGLSLILPISLAGCGMETATTAATVAAAKAEEAKQARNTRDQMEDKINAAMLANQQKLQDADKNQ